MARSRHLASLAKSMTNLTIESRQRLKKLLDGANVEEKEQQEMTCPLAQRAEGQRACKTRGGVTSAPAVEGLGNCM